MSDDTRTPISAKVETLVRERFQLDGDLLDAARQGNRVKLVNAVDAAVQRLLDDSALQEVTREQATALLLADHAIQLRRDKVSQVGQHEQFVRRTDAGRIEQVIRPVTLLVAAKDLFQLTKTTWVDPEDHSRRVYGEFKDWAKANGGKWPHRLETPVDDTASTRVQGFQKIQAVAGCHVWLPQTVEVDGVPQSNPCVMRMQKPNGRLGDIVRIMINVVVLGYAPGSGQMVATNYILDYDPRKELVSMLANLATTGTRDRKNDSRDDVVPYVELVAEEEFEEQRQAGAKKGWKYTEVYDGVGYAHDLRSPEVRKVYSDFQNILANATKKALTVARRNAMRNHPALGSFQTVQVRNGRAVVGVVGWVGDKAEAERMLAIATMCAEGCRLSDLVERGLIRLDSVVDKVESYDADDVNSHIDGTGDDRDGEDPLFIQRNRLIEQLDEVMLKFPDTSVPRELGYSGSFIHRATMEELRTMLEQAVERLQDDADSDPDHTPDY